MTCTKFVKSKLEQMSFPFNDVESYSSAFYEAFEATLDSVHDRALWQLCMRYAKDDFTPNIPDYNKTTDAIITPVLTGNDYEQICPSILVGTDSKGNQKVVVSKMHNIDGGGV